MSQAIFAIKSAVNTFISDLDGYIGLAPPRNGIERMRSFLFNAWKDGLIEHMVFALYTSVRNDIPSTLKFGSYDPSGIKDGEQLTYIQTRNSTTWGLSAAYFIVFDHTIYTDSTPKVALIEPQYPYLYIPQHEFESFRGAVNDVYKDANCKLTYCYFSKPCD